MSAAAILCVVCSKNCPVCGYDGDQFFSPNRECPQCHTIWVWFPSQECAYCEEPYPVDNGNGTGSLKGKLVGMGF